MNLYVLGLYDLPGQLCNLPSSRKHTTSLATRFALNFKTHMYILMAIYSIWFRLFALGSSEAIFRRSYNLITSSVCCARLELPLPGFLQQTLMNELFVNWRQREDSELGPGSQTAKGQILISLLQMCPTSNLLSLSVKWVKTEEAYGVAVRFAKSTWSVYRSLTVCC